MKNLPLVKWLKNSNRSWSTTMISPIDNIAEIVAFIKTKIADYKKGIVAKNRDFRNLVTGKKFADKTWYSLFNILQKERKEVLKYFTVFKCATSPLPRITAVL